MDTTNPWYECWSRESAAVVFCVVLRDNIDEGIYEEANNGNANGICCELMHPSGCNFQDQIVLRLQQQFINPQGQMDSYISFQEALVSKYSCPGPQVLELSD